MHKYIKFCIKPQLIGMKYIKYGVDNEYKLKYNLSMLANLLSISELAIKVIAGASGIVLALVIALILIFRKKDDKD